MARRLRRLTRTWSAFAVMAALPERRWSMTARPGPADVMVIGADAVPSSSSRAARVDAGGKDHPVAGPKVLAVDPPQRLPRGRALVPDARSEPPGRRSTSPRRPAPLPEAGGADDRDVSAKRHSHWTLSRFASGSSTFSTRILYLLPRCESHRCDSPCTYGRIALHATTSRLLRMRTRLVVLGLLVIAVLTACGATMAPPARPARPPRPMRYRRRWTGRPGR